MARPVLPDLSMKNLHYFQHVPAVTFFFALIAVFSVFSIVTYLCASHKARKSSQRLKTEVTSESSEKRLLSKLNSNITSKAHLMAKMISWRKVQVGEDEDDDEDEEVWRRTIIMGERCRPIDFSGKILYDSQGNLLPDSEPSSHQNPSKSVF